MSQEHLGQICRHKIAWKLNSCTPLVVVAAPVLTVMDGFGRELLDQYYKAGSSLEVMCAVDRLPADPLPNVIEWRHGDRKLPLRNITLGQRFVRFHLAL